MSRVGSASWNDQMYVEHSTPYSGIAGLISRYRVNKIIGAITEKDPVIVEVGCESGRLLAELQDALPNAHIAGVDISKSALEDASTKLRDVDLIQCDITESSPDMPFENIDYLICSETLEHIPDTDAALKNLYRMSGDNTALIITVPIERFKNQIKHTLKTLRVFDLLFPDIEDGFSEWHIHSFSRDELESAISDYLKIQSYKNILFMHHMIVASKK